VSAWPGLASRLEGRIVVLEPLAERHAPGLDEAARDPRIWRFMREDIGRDPAVFRAWLEEALAAARSGTEVPFAILSAASGAPIGSTRYLALRPEHRSLEVGGTWLTPARWGTGANAEAKLLLLEHAFDRNGCLRVEFKTDSRNERSRAALAALPAQFEGVHRRHMLVRGGQRRDSAWYSVIDSDWPVVRASLQRRLATVSVEVSE
jgi:RimJ/RimL family protein N-acetyltransferase